MQEWFISLEKCWRLNFGKFINFVSKQIVRSTVINSIKNVKKFDGF